MFDRKLYENLIENWIVKYSPSSPPEWVIRSTVEQAGGKCGEVCEGKDTIYDGRSKTETVFRKLLLEVYDPVERWDAGPVAHIVLSTEKVERQV